VQQHGRLGAYGRLITENDALIRGSELRTVDIVTARAAVHVELVRMGRGPAADPRLRSPFAVVALGDGRGSDAVPPDFAFG
jgi:hypothetical protein